tara:strand:- start:41358 stop:41537 length:180 start_codon:yes stop_codon:yes gene_type:complete
MSKLSHPSGTGKLGDKFLFSPALKGVKIIMNKQSHPLGTGKLGEIFYFPSPKGRKIYNE